MNGFNGFVTNSDFNRFVNLDNIEWHIVDYLAKSESKYAKYFWKILKYDTEDCLSKEDLTYKEKIDLVYRNNGDSTPYRVFLSPYTDDGWEVQSSHFHVYVHSIQPQTRLTAVVNIGIECIVHNKISNILGDASEYNEMTNPSEIHDGEIVVPYKSRATVFAKCVLAALNGVYLNGVGVLQLNNDLSGYDMSKLSLWNGKKFFGHNIVMSTILSGVSDNDESGY